MGIVITMFILVFIAIVLVIYMRLRPRVAMNKIKQAGDLRGKSYDEIHHMFGKPSSVSYESDGSKSSVSWFITNGKNKSISITAMFDSNEICVDYFYDTDRY